MQLDSVGVVILAVILARLLVPLLIVRWPLPAIVASLVLDAVDQTVFQAVAPEADLSGYQSYDKALDVYYLVIAYISTLRNWTNRAAVVIARFLIFYRLVGVVLFELTGVRELLFVFPNTFEYFFIFYEAVRLFWDPRRMRGRLLIGATAFIWIVIKLPQEWWIHIAMIDTTDLVQESVFGVPAGTPWIETFAARPWVVVLAVVAVVAAMAVLWWLARRYLPPRDRPLTVDSDAEASRALSPERLASGRAVAIGRLMRPALLEKVLLIALVGVIFGKLLGVRGEPLEFAVLISIVVVANAVMSAWLERHGVGPGSAIRQFVVTGVLNTIIALVLLVDLERLDATLDLASTAFFLFLVTLLVTMYDRYRPEFLARFPSPGREAA